MKGSEHMPKLRVTGITAAQSRAMQDVQRNAPGLIEQVNRSSIIFRGAPGECRDHIQTIMDAVREANGAGTVLNSLRSVRDKLDDATRGGTSYVSVITENGVNTEGEIPLVLAGLRVDGPGESATVPAQRERVPAQGGDVLDEVLDRMRPTLPQPELTPGCRHNFEYMRHHAVSDSARQFWADMLSKLPVAT